MKFNQKYFYKGSVNFLMIYGELELVLKQTNFKQEEKNEDIDVFYLSRSYYGLARQSIRKNSGRIILFEQT